MDRHNNDEERGFRLWPGFSFLARWSIFAGAAAANMSMRAMNASEQPQLGRMSNHGLEH